MSINRIYLMLVCMLLSLAVLAKEKIDIYKIEPNKVKWLKKDPSSKCGDLIKNIEYILTKDNYGHKLSFLFKGIKYNAPDLSNSSSKLSFQYAADTDLGSESITIKIDAVVLNRKVKGNTNIEIVRDSSILVKGYNDKWEKHKYDCSVSYQFKGYLKK